MTARWTVFAVYSHSIQGCPVHSHCHVLQYASHTQTHMCGPLSLLMQTQDWPMSPAPSNPHYILQARVSVCGNLSSRTQPHVLVCVCSPTSSVPSYLQCVHPVLPLCAVFSLHVIIQTPLYKLITQYSHQIIKICIPQMFA